MADINFSSPQTAPDSRATDARPSPARDGALRWDIIELLFFAYRDFVGDADHELEAFGFGRAHHQAVARAGAEAVAGRRLYRAEDRQQRPPPAPALCHAQGRGAGRQAR